MEDGHDGRLRHVQVAAAPFERCIQIYEDSECDPDDACTSDAVYERVGTPKRQLKKQKSVHFAEETPRHSSKLNQDEAKEESYKALYRRPQEASAHTTSIESSGSSASAATSASSSALSKPFNPAQELGRFTNRFHEHRLEESYQLYSSTCDFPIARRVILFVLLSHIVAYVLFLWLRASCSRPSRKYVEKLRQEQRQQLQARPSSFWKKSLWSIHEECWDYDLPFDEDISMWYRVALWLFAPVAFFYGFFPLKYAESTMRLRIGVYYVRRHWKRMAAVIVLMWAIGLDLFAYQMLALLKKQLKQEALDVTPCGRTTPLDDSWYIHSKWRDRHLDDPVMNVSNWISMYEGKLTNSIMLGVLSLLATVAGIVSVAMKLDFVHVAWNSIALWATTLYLLIWKPPFPTSRGQHQFCNHTILFTFCIIAPSILALLATYTEDRASRLAYVSKVRAERINTTLKLDLSNKRTSLENKRISREEEQAMADALFHSGADDEDEREFLQAIAIPFEELQLKELIAKNPSAEILVAEYHGTPVVLKRLAMASCTAEGLREFKCKVELMACLRHPNIVLLIGATYDNLANVGMVLEYLERGDVATLLRSSMALTWNDPLLKIATDVAQGVSYLHNCDPPLVHRDLKASNLLCTATYSCKISDFGESKRQSMIGKLFSTIVGTPYWLAPEILREEKYDISVDCYSFGIVLIELETRKDPYFDQSDAWSTIEIMMAVAQRGLRPTIPSTCAPKRRELILRCLSADPTQRPKMTEILSILQNDVRQEILSQDALEDPTQDKRRMMLMQRHQRLNRHGVGDLLRQQSTSSDESD